MALIGPHYFFFIYTFQHIFFHVISPANYLKTEMSAMPKSIL